MPFPSDPTTPTWQRHQALTPHRFRLIPFRSPLLRESLLLSIPWATKMFQFAQFPLPALYIQTGVTPHNECWVSPFGHPRIKAWSAAPRGISQPPTSFIGSTCQGIHRWLFVTWKSTKMLVLAMQFSTSNNHHRAVETEDSRQKPRRSRSLTGATQTRHSLKAEERTIRTPTQPKGESKNPQPRLASTNDRLVIN